MVIPSVEEFFLDGLGWGGVVHSTECDVIMDVVSVFGLVTLNVVIVILVICQFLNLSPSSTSLHVFEGLGESTIQVRELLLFGMGYSQGHLKEVTTSVSVDGVLYEVFGEVFLDVGVSTNSTGVSSTGGLSGSSEV